MADRVIDVIKSQPPGDGSAAILELFNKSESEGALAIAAKQSDCASAERQLADLENASSPVPQPATPAASGAQAATFAAQSAASAIRGISSNEIRFGISAPLSGPSKDLGQQMRVGIETAFRAANSEGGIYGRMLRLVAADDGYEPAVPPKP